MLKSIGFFSFYIAICISKFPLFPHISNRWISVHLIIAALKRKSIEFKNKWSWCWMAIVYRNKEEVLPPSDRLSDGDKSSPNLSIAMTVYQVHKITTVALWDVARSVRWAKCTLRSAVWMSTYRASLGAVSKHSIFGYMNLMYETIVISGKPRHQFCSEDWMYKDTKYAVYIHLTCSWRIKHVI